MAVWTPPYVQQNADHGTALWRSLLAGQFGRSGGYVVGGSGELAVSQDTGANMQVQVAAGGIVIPGTEESGQGSYYGYNDGAVTLTVEAADVTYNRRDLVVATVKDTYYGGLTDVWELAVIKGPVDGSDALPALPVNSVALAHLDINVGTVAVTNALITDVRHAVPSSGPVLCTSTNRPTAPLWNGMVIYETDTHLMYVRSSATWKLLPIGGAVYVAPAGSQDAGFAYTRTSLPSVPQSTWVSPGSGGTKRAGAANYADATGRFTAPVEGVYTASLTFSADPNDDSAIQVSGRIVSNYAAWGNPILYQGMRRNNGDIDPAFVTVAGELPCVAGGTLTYNVRHKESGSARTLENFYLTARWASPIPA